MLLDIITRTVTENEGKRLEFYGTTDLEVASEFLVKSLEEVFSIS